MHHHIVQKILAIILKGLLREEVYFFLRPSSSADSLEIFSDMGSCLSHEETEQVTHDDAEEFLRRPGYERRKELKEKKVDIPMHRRRIPLFHPIP